MNNLKHIKPINLGMPLCSLLGAAETFGSDFDRPIAGHVHVVNGELEETLANVRGLRGRATRYARQLNGAKARNSEAAEFLKELAEDLAMIERQVLSRLNGAVSA